MNSVGDGFASGIFTLLALVQKEFVRKSEFCILRDLFPATESVQKCAHKKHGVLAWAPTSRPVESGANVIHGDRPVVNVVQVSQLFEQDFKVPRAREQGL